jgi:polyferredoxin
MAKLKRPPGLIRYASEVGLAGGTRRVLRPRTVLYAVLLVILGTVAVWRVTDRQPILATLLRPVGMPLFVEQDGGRWVRQAVTLSLVNRSGAAQQLTISIPAEPAARIALQHALIDLPVDARIELTPTIDLPAERLTDDLRPALRLTAADGRTTDLSISLRRP